MTDVYLFFDPVLGTYLDQNKKMMLIYQLLTLELKECGALPHIYKSNEVSPGKVSVIVTGLVGNNAAEILCTGIKPRIKKILDRVIPADCCAYNGNIVIHCDNSYSGPVDVNNPSQGGDSSSANDQGALNEYEQLSQRFIPTDPNYSFENVILAPELLERLEEALGIVKYRQQVFEEWGLKYIQPHPVSALSFYGPSGTGKTMAAEAIASKLGKQIIRASYADIESKYHGEGPKMVKAIFNAANRHGAVLFIDEADSLLSARLTNVTQGSEQAINSMRSQLLICLQEFEGIVIFATNLVKNYDKAFLTRIISIAFEEPDAPTRQKIWQVHMFGPKLSVPWAADVDEALIEQIAKDYEFCGRDIRNAVINACVQAKLKELDVVTKEQLLSACDKVVKEKNNVAEAGRGKMQSRPLTPEESDELGKKFIQQSMSGDSEPVQVQVQPLDGSEPDLELKPEADLKTSA